MNYAGMIAIIGAPNAGKSTLVNALVGQKITIVSPKVQTTRFCVRGVLTEGAHQAVLVDTPGIFEPSKKFEQSLVKEAFAGLKGVDAMVVVVDVSRPISNEVHTLLKRFLAPANTEAVLAEQPQKMALVLNKIDMIDKRELLRIVQWLSEDYQLPSLFMISAKKRDGLHELKKWMFALLPEHPFYYPEDQVSDVEMQRLAAEITREKLFIFMRQELPYQLTVIPESWEEKAHVAVIKHAIVVTRENHKKMIIGNQGETLKKVGESARKEIERICEKKVHLTLFVKVDAAWQEKTMTMGQHYEG